MAARRSSRSNRSGFGYEPRVGRSVEWYTPPELFDALGIVFDLDPAAPPGGIPWVPARRHYSAIEDGLAQPWRGRVWLNPPYGSGVGNWLDRLVEHGDGIALVFARTDTRWFHRAVPKASAVCFVAGRLRFICVDEEERRITARAPSLLLAYGLTCAVALTEAGLGQTFPVPNGGVLGQRQSAACSLAPLRSRNKNGPRALRKGNTS